MSFSEFKAWLDGFSASFKDGAPDAGEWSVIQEKLAKVMIYKPSDTPTLPKIGQPWLGERPPRTWYETDARFAC